MKTRSFDELRIFLKVLHKSKSLRQIAIANFDGQITHAVIDRCIKGREPHDEAIRKALNLPEIMAQEFWRNEKGQRVKTPHSH